MKKWKKILQEQRAEGYIDVVVLVLCAMLVIALAVRVFPIYITKLQLDNFADELIREAEISGCVGTQTRERTYFAGKNRAYPYCYLVKNRKHTVK